MPAYPRIQGDERIRTAVCEPGADLGVRTPERTGPLDLLADHRSLPALVGRDYFIAGSDTDDVEQEAFIALWEAARSFRPELGVPFEAFARDVIRRRLADAITRAERLKHRPLSYALRSTTGEDGGPIDPIDLVSSRAPSTEDRVIELEELREIVARILGLTTLERRSIVRAINGLGPADKADDNALWRARRKLRSAA